MINKLAILTALKKTVDHALESERAIEDDSLAEAYQNDGVEKKALMVNGEKVGTIQVNFSKPRFNITDPAAFNDFALTYGLAYEEYEVSKASVQLLAEKMKDLMEPEDFNSTFKVKVIPEDGWDKALEVVDGTVMLSGSPLVVPGVEYVGPKPKNTMVRGCEPDKVIPLLRQLPGGIEQLLLGGGEDD